MALAGPIGAGCSLRADISALAAVIIVRFDVLAQTVTAGIIGRALAIAVNTGHVIRTGIAAVAAIFIIIHAVDALTVAVQIITFIGHTAEIFDTNLVFAAVLGA